ncbi:MAG: flagellar filament capping protein FliD [Burkholderiales bacterium]|nr:flagellar filament capping protein FliD [Burkholderiales bacterium]MDE2454211.1 flagellar filament capping protein FliD [Burkholderiales bacterium]
MTGGISSPGVGSGLDVNAIVDKLVAIEHRPVELLQKQAAGIQARLSNFSMLKSYMANVQSAAAKLADLSFWRASTASSSNPAAVLALAAKGDAVPGSYRVEVASLAQAQTTASAAVADPKAGLGAGQLHIDFGSWSADGSAFSPADGAKSMDITIEEGHDSLEAVRDQINAAKGGVTATLLSDASGTRLVLLGSASGEANGFRISASGPGGAAPPGLAALAYDPPAGATQTARTQTAANASLTINGIALQSASNTVDASIPGLALSLKQVTQGAVDVTVASDTGAMRTAVQNLVTAYNEMTTYIADQTRYDAANRRAAPLNGDSMTLALQRQLRAAFSATSEASPAFPSLLDLGIRLQAGNTLAIDAAKLDEALARPQDLAQAFAANTAGTGGDGFGVRIKALAAQALGFEGLITRGTNALNDSVRRNADQQARMEARIEKVRDRLLRQYNSLDQQMGKLTAQSNFVNQQLLAMFKRS